MMENILSDIARVKISPEIMEVARKPLTYQRKLELRRAKVVAYIRSKPYGTKIRTAEFQAVTGQKSASATWQMIQNMIKHGEIVQHPIAKRTFFYTAPELQVVTHVADKVEADQPKTAFAPIKGIDVPAEATESSAVSVSPGTTTYLEAQARWFSWQYPDEGNDLRAFIKWLNRG